VLDTAFALHGSVDTVEVHSVVSSDPDIIQWSEAQDDDNVFER